jgi:O-antigen ligase
MFLVCYVPLLQIYLPRTDFGPGIPDVDAARLCSYMLFLVFMFVFFTNRRLRYRLVSVWTLIICLFTIIACLSVYWSQRTYTFAVLANLFNSVFLPFLVAIIACNILREESAVKRYIKHIVIAACVLSLISICQWLLGTHDPSDSFRSTGTLGNPNLLAVFLVLTIPCILYAFYNRIVPLGLALFAQVAVIAGVICTVSRKGLMTMLITYTLFFIVTKRIKKAIVLITVAAILSVLLISYGLLSERLHPEQFQRTLNEKWSASYAGWRMYLDSPIIGLGYRGYYDNVPKYSPPLWGDVQFDAHNEFITVLANYGTLGFIPFISIFLYPLRKAARILNKNTKPKANEYLTNAAIICLLSIVPFMINALFAAQLIYESSVVYLLYSNIAIFLSAYFANTLEKTVGESHVS